MAGFLDVLLRGALLLCVSGAAGGVAWTRLVLRARAHDKPDGAAARALRLTALAAGLAAAAQAATELLVLASVPGTAGLAAAGAWIGTWFARVAVARVALAALVGGLALRLARRPAGPVAWAALAGTAAALVLSSAALSHAAARMEGRLVAGALDAVHQLAVAVWVGGLAHLTLFAARARREPDPRAPVVLRRFSTLALAAVAAIVGTGAGLTVLYVGDAGALLGTAYGWMVASKVVLLLAGLGLAAANFRLVRRPGSPGVPLRLARFVEVELGLAVTVLFAAASLTSLPPGVDVKADRATPAEVAARFLPGLPRLASPPVADLLRQADPLMAPPGERKAVERAWSESNHHWAGLSVLLMGGLACLEAAGLRRARHWPLAFLGLAAFMFVRNDPRAWPLGPAGFWESMTLPDVLQHRAFVLLVVAFAAFEWMVRTGRLRPRPWAYVFPLLCAVGGGLLLTHSHALLSLKEEFLVEVSHIPLGVLGVFAGWARWLELRLPGRDVAPGWIWRGCLVAAGVVLLMYREG